ncbi:NAD+ synthase [Prochlorococcus sp. MIT 1307]|uniref:NAD+ synthase n=1 Tax=Prochlorococcus sp. MIT 1307 TaxID=3096219 RepID=UPI002A754834|nr:NAD+ synthase [Prochlorococcus sp. MIT 1307]
MRLALAQINPLIGDLKGNSQIILEACRKAASEDADLLLTPELSLWGYPPKDLLLNTLLFEEQRNILDELTRSIALEAKGLRAVIGIAEPTQDIHLPTLFNSIVLVESSGWKVIARKQLLPTYDVFDEKRYFRPGEGLGALNLEINQRIWNIGITICEDLWVDEKLQGQRVLGPDPIAELESQKIDLLINLSASPFSHNKTYLRQSLASKAVERLQCPVIYLNQVGGNDELVFDGASFVLNAKGELVLTLPICKKSLVIWSPTSQEKSGIERASSKQEELFQALVLGVKDYAKKCGFDSAIVGLSGGIDSSLVTIIATAALGSKNVTAVLMPSPWSSIGSIQDSLGLANRLGICTKTLPINSLMQTYDATLKDPLGQLPEGITAENLQSRIRGTLLMALANQKGHLLLSTGNKSELAIGYCTLYGDMNGGLSVIGDLYKTCVFDLCKWLDSKAASPCKSALGLPSHTELVGETILKKPPSAELRPGQLDSDSIPAYEILDPILKGFVEDRKSSQELINSGHCAKFINQIEKLLKKAEFKRRQAPPSLKVSNQAFGSGWRLPIAAK